MLPIHSIVKPESALPYGLVLFGGLADARLLLDFRSVIDE